MTGRPGDRTMEMNGKGTVSYLVRTPRKPFFTLILIGLEAKNLLAFEGRRGIASVVRWNFRPVIFGVEIRHFQPRKLQCFSSQFALHGLRALEGGKEDVGNRETRSRPRFFPSGPGAC